MEENDVLDLTAQMLELTSIELNKIPDIDLYMDQILTFFDDKLKNYKRNENEKLLTKTMINNYSKDKILPPPVNKKYSKTHIILLILIYHMKSALTINDINIILKNIESDGDINIFDFYNAFINIQKLEASRIAADTKESKKMISNLNPHSEKEFKLLTILSLIIESNIKKLLAQKMIDGLS